MWKYLTNAIFQELSKFLRKFLDRPGMDILYLYLSLALALINNNILDGVLAKDSLSVHLVQQLLQCISFSLLLKWKFYMHFKCPQHNQTSNIQCEYIWQMWSFKNCPIFAGNFEIDRVRTFCTCIYIWLWHRYII